MKLRTLRDWITAKESSAATRSKTQAALGLGPTSTSAASVFGRSTPPPWQVERLTKKKKGKGKGYKGHPELTVKNDIWTIPEEDRSPDYTFDKWLQSALVKAQELSDAKKAAEEEDEKLDKEIDAKLKDKEEPELEPEQDKDQDHSQDKEEEESEEIGKDARWTGHRREQEDREKADIGLSAGREPS